MSLLPYLLFAIPLIVSTVNADEKPHAEKAPPEFKKLKYRSIGPATGGRVSRVAGVPGDPLTYYAADSCRRRLEVRRRRHLLEADLRRSAGVVHRLHRRGAVRSERRLRRLRRGQHSRQRAAGNGIYNSTDAGKTWKHVWKQDGQIGTMIVHPEQSRHRLRRRAGPCVRPQPGTRRLSHHRRRQDLETVLFKDRRHRRHRRLLRSEQSAHPLRRPVANRRKPGK